MRRTNRIGRFRAWMLSLPGRCAPGIALSLFISAAFPALALAQTLDYGSLEQLFGEPVTTSATGSPQRVTEAPANMEIVTADEIRRSGAYDIPGVLRHVLGVDVLRWNNDNADVSLRGYDQVRSPRVLVLIDGRQVYADHYGYTPWDALPVELSAIRQIEVVKGPNTALFGFNAVSGVINIITYNPLYDDVGTASIGGGTQNIIQGSLVKTFKLNDRTALRLTAGGGLDDDFSTPTPASAGTLQRRGNDRFEFGAEGMIRLADRIHLGLEVTHSEAYSNKLDPIYGLELNRNFASSVKGQLSAETGLGLIQAIAYTNWASQHSLNERKTPIKFEDEVTVVQLQDLFRVGAAHTFRASAEYRHNSVGTSPFAGATIFYDLYSAGGMWNWNITRNVSLTNAVRFDDLQLGRDGPTPAGYPFVNADWNRTIQEWSFNSGLVWNADDADTVRLLVARGVQLPSLNSFGAFLLTSPFANLTGQPSIAPTTAMSYEIDWDHILARIAGQFRAAVFYESLEDLITVAGGNLGGGPPPYRGQLNAGNSDAKGIELSLKGMFEQDWRWGVTYRYESIKDSFLRFAQNGTGYIDFEHVTPNHTVNANLGWARGRWEIDGFLYYQSATRGLVGLPFGTGSFLTPVQAYVSFDARIGYRLTDWATLSVSGQNLFASPQQQTSGPKVERRILGTLSVDF